MDTNGTDMPYGITDIAKYDLNSKTSMMVMMMMMMMMTMNCEALSALIYKHLDNT